MSRTIPVRWRIPHWSSTVDFDPVQAAHTRNTLFAQFAGRPIRILGAHFVGGRIARDGDAYRIIM